MLIFVADHISIPADARRMDMTDKDRYQRIRETLGQYCAIVELARVEEGEAVRWLAEYCATQEVKIDSDAARELVDALGGDMMMISNELEKLILYVGEKKRITLGDVETMVLAAKQRSLYELTDAISSKDRVRALEMLDAILTTGEGDEAAIGHLYMLAKTFRQMLVIVERNVRDQRMLWAALWQGFRVPPFAADDIIRRRAATNPRANSPAPFAWLPRPISPCAPIRPASAWCWRNWSSTSPPSRSQKPDGCRKSCRSENRRMTTKEIFPASWSSFPVGSVRHLLAYQRHQDPRHAAERVLGFSIRHSVY